MPRDVSLSDSKCWNSGHEWVKNAIKLIPATRSCTHREIFSESLLNQTKIRLYLFIGLYLEFDLEPNGLSFAVPNQSVHVKYNPISV